MTGDAGPGLPRRRAPDLADLAAFTVGPTGLVTNWPDSAARLLGQPAGEAAGRDVCDVLLTGPGERAAARHALAEVAAGRAWTGTLTGGRLGDDRFAMRWEPLGRAGGAMVLLRRAWPQPRPRWLAEAAGDIGGTLDLGVTAAEVAEAVVPAFADAVSVYVVERLITGEEAAAPRSARDTAVRRVAGLLPEGTAASTASVLPPGEVVIFDAGTPGFQVMTTGQPVLSDQLDHQSAARLSRRPGGSQVATLCVSFLALPLIARGTVVGCLMLGRTVASTPFTPDELPHAAELANHAAVRIDNALLYHRERRTARALQQGLLPRVLPPMPAAAPGLDIASRYLAVGSNVVGGDWHDVIALPSGRTAIVVGDVMGHGPEAAAAMGQLRTAAHVLADLEVPPGQLLRRLDRMLGAITMAPFATCVCAVTGPEAPTGRDTVTGPDALAGPAAGRPAAGAPGWSCAASRAGHPPPVIVLPGGKARVLDLPADLPLGLGEASFAETSIGLPPGATLALYTDGLVEVRGRTIDDGLADLCVALETALAAPGATLDEVCEAVTRGLSGHSEDDITLVLARTRQ